ncbi:cyclin-dependent kinase, putative [Eimeria brunetti]|uniref:Cyclin-dependent kinases regulatory subunit n=1 Tax=Eimeria brunetti TaxID=51314 RepID=U6LFU1_9EIME|nr:cyclin-dependent kinase, putative [Eimeria brunetti]
MSPSMSRKRHQQEPPIPPVSPSLPPCHLSQHPSTESPPDPLNLRPSDPSISDKKGRRSGRRFASLQRLCDCCVSPKRRRGPRRPRPNLRFTSVATGAASTDTADEGGQIPHFSPSCSSSSSNSSARTRRRRSSGATAKATSPSEAASSLTDAAESRRTTSVCCSSGCETETFLPTSASGRDEPAGVYAYPCLAKTRSKHASPVAAGIGDLGQPGTATSAAARENILLHGSSRGAEELNVLQSQLLHRQLQQRQQQQRAGNLGLLCNLSAGQRTAGIFYKAAAGVSAVAAAAGAAAVACECIRHKAAQTAAMLHPWSSRTLLSERVAAVSAAAEAAVTSASSAAEATGCDDRPVPACCENATTAAAAAAAAEASRAAYLREELLNLAESRYTAVFVPVDKQLLEQMNDEFIRSDISRYPVKNTPAGIVFYSPRYTDDRFIYRHVLLSAGVKKAAEEIANAAKSVFLTEGQFIYQLGIHLSPGWEHFMIFKGEMRELILRRPQQQQDSPNSQDHVQSDEVSEESDDSEPEEPTMPAAATESQSSPRHQDIGRLLQQIAETATIHQVTQQKSLLQQQIAIARAVEKANRLLLLMVQLQRPAQQLPPKMFDMRCCLEAAPARFRRNGVVVPATQTAAAAPRFNATESASDFHASVVSSRCHRTNGQPAYAAARKTTTE